MNNPMTALGRRTHLRAALSTSICVSFFSFIDTSPVIILSNSCRRHVNAPVTRTLREAPILPPNENAAGPTHSDKVPVRSLGLLCCIRLLPARGCRRLHLHRLRPLRACTPTQLGLLPLDQYTAASEC